MRYKLFYGLEGDEQVYSEIETVVERYVDMCWPHLPTTLTVTKYAPLDAALARTTKSI